MGAGLGRHSIFFAQQGFEVSAIDISDYGVNYLKEWSEKENLDMDIKLGDIMVCLPYADNSLDCVFAYHAISHTDSPGITKLVSEIERVLKPGGEVYTSMCSKESWDFAKAGYPKIDKNTVLIKEDGPANDVQHFFANREDILNLFNNFDIERIRHIDYCYINSEK